MQLATFSISGVERMSQTNLVYISILTEYCLWFLKQRSVQKTRDKLLFQASKLLATLFHLHAALTFFIGSSIFWLIQTEHTGPTVLFPTTALAVKAASPSQTKSFLSVCWPLFNRASALWFRVRAEILRKKKKKSLNPCNKFRLMRTFNLDQSTSQ